MRTNVVIDDDLLDEAIKLSGRAKGEKFGRTPILKIDILFPEPP